MGPTAHSPHLVQSGSGIQLESTVVALPPPDEGGVNDDELSWQLEPPLNAFSPRMIGAIVTPRGGRSTKRSHRVYFDHTKSASVLRRQLRCGRSSVQRPGVHRSQAFMTICLGSSTKGVLFLAVKRGTSHQRGDG